MKQTLIAAFLFASLNTTFAQVKKSTVDVTKKTAAAKPVTGLKKENTAAVNKPEETVKETVIPKKVMPVINLDIYAKNEDEQAVIKELDSLYPNTIITAIDNVYNLFYNRKFDVLKHLITKFEVKPTADYLVNLNTYDFVCGVGLKRKKDYSPACVPVKVYETNKESERKIALAQLIIDKGVKASSNALNSCIGKNEFELFKLLYQNFDNATSKEIEGEKLMVSAADYGCFDFVKYLLENNISANAYDHSVEEQGFKFYALYRSVKYPEIFNLLVEKGADINVQGYAGTTTIIHAAREGCTEVIQYLLDKKIDPYEVHGNMSAYDMAKKYNKKNKKEVLELFKPLKK
jgi:Ankyrin repeats (3 copies)